LLKLVYQAVKCKKKFKDTTGNQKPSKNGIQYNDQKNKDNWTNNYIQNTTQKAID